MKLCAWKCVYSEVEDLFRRKNCIKLRLNMYTVVASIGCTAMNNASKFDGKCIRIIWLGTGTVVLAESVRQGGECI